MTWQTRAACAVEPEPSDWDDEVYSDVEFALEICAGCPVKAECLAAAMASHSHGVWGGTTTAERRERRAARAETKRRAS